MIQRILIADDEPLFLRTTGEMLRREGYDCVCVPDADAAKQKLEDENFDLVLSDLNMPGNLGLELLREHSLRRKHIPIIVITGVPSLPSAIESVRLGITDYLLKPVKFETLLRSVRDALQHAAQTQAAAALPSRAPSELQTMFPEIIGASPPMLEVLEIIDRISATDTNILITGESGTGKEVIAKAIHKHSLRSAGAFQVIDCTAIPDSLFESMLFGHTKGAFTGAINEQAGLLRQCDGGTAFFDELGELPLPLQAKLLRAVQEQTFTPVGSHTPVSVDTRFICATNRDLSLEVSSGRFRQDLFYRLGVIHIELPPLRNRGDDVLLLAEDFLKSGAENKATVKRFSEATLDCLRNYHWPGNIRELRNAMERTVAFCDGNLIQPSDLPETIRHCAGISRGAVGVVSPPGCKTSFDGKLSTSSLSAEQHHLSREEALKNAEYQYLLGLLRMHKGNVSEASRQAGLSRQGLHKLIKSHHLRAADFRA